MTERHFFVAAQAIGGDSLKQFFSSPMAPMLVFMGFMIFMMFRSQQKEAKKRKEMMNSIKSGDKVVTGGGIHGVVTNVKENTFIVKIAENVKVEVNKSGVVGIIQNKDEKQS
jgi:preprotein translocase subunit YajC